MAERNDNYFGIKSLEGARRIEKVEKGWSSDVKYYIEEKSGKRLLLRLSDIEKYEGKKKEYDVICRFSELGFPMTSPIEFGVCNHGKNCYMLLEWVDGQDLEEVLPGLGEKEQYLLGREAGRILRKIHSLPIAAEDIPTKTKRDKKLTQLSRYEASSLRIDGDVPVLKFVKDNIDLIWKESPVYLHGDFHPGNLIYSGDGKIAVIDFNRWEVGDPYEEFYKLESFGVEISIPFCIGQIDSYFDDDIPESFWKTLSVYSAHASLFSIVWAEKFGQKDIDGMIKRAYQAFSDFDGFKSFIPKWYTDKYRNKYLV